ncbi:MAG: alanine racemase [Saprospiraceae bacterium]|jgi:alanine racemase
MNYKPTYIAEITNGQLIQVAKKEAMIRHLLSDSRQIISPQTGIFIALKGEQHNGHLYLKAAYQAGVRCFLISEKESIQQLPQATIIFVENTLVAIQKLAAAQREKFSYPVIAITGSNGKTVVKEWLFQLLRESFHIVRSPKSYNSQVGVPLSVLAMEDTHDLAIFEAGISQVNEMGKLEKIIQPSIGILTNIGAVHDEGFASKEEKINEKIKLFIGTEKVICEWRYAQYFKKDKARKVLTWGREKEADLQILRITKRGKESRISANWQGQKISITLLFQDAASLENVMHCWLTLLTLNIDNQSITERTRQLEQVAMRLELKQGSNDSLLINDSYNSDLTSLKIALRLLEQQSKDLKRTIVLSDILQSGKKSAELYPAVAELLIKYQIDYLVGIGSEVVDLKTHLPKSINSDFHKSTEAFLAQFNQKDFKESVILLKGARHFTFEKITARLEQKTHNAVLEVNLNSLLHNLKVYRSYLQPKTKLLVMVKASAYGSGSMETTKLLEYQQVDYFGVAYADEGTELRKGGIKTPILVLNPEPSTFNQLLRYKLEPEIYSLKQLKELLHFLQVQDKKMGIHLKLETGMNRLGFDEDNLMELGNLLNQSKNIKVLSIFSHLASSDMKDHDNFTKKQANRFDKNYTIICQSIGYEPFQHILNSSGINRFPQYHKDMVRLGIGIYGIDSSAEISAQLRVVNTLKAVISQIKTLDKGATVGYGRHGKVDAPTRTATIGIGYADGLLRAAGNGNYSFLLHGKRAPIIGNVCMDMCMIDVTHIPEAQEGDSVVIFGDNPRAEELAVALGTIPYEVFTNVSQRVKRIYVEE